MVPGPSLFPSSHPATLSTLLYSPYAYARNLAQHFTAIDDNLHGSMGTPHQEKGKMDTISEAADGAVTRTEHAARAQRKLNTPKTKAGGKYGHPSRIGSVILCLLGLVPTIIYIVTALLSASAGLSALQRSTMPALEHARLEANGIHYAVFVEQQVNNQLDQLTATRLSRKFIETYDECLARGLRHANAQFYGVGFQYLHVRNQTIDWVTDNCGSLHHAPQTMQPSFQVKIITQITRASHGARRMAEMLANFAASKAKALWAKLPTHGLLKTLVAKHQQALTSATPKRRLQEPSLRKSAWMPFGFRLLCEDTSSCQLVYAPKLSRRTPTDKAPLPDDAVLKALTKYQSLLSLHRGLHLMKSALIWLVLMLAPLQFAGVIHWFVMQALSIKAYRRPFNRQPSISKIALDLLRRYGTEEPINAVCLTTQILSLVTRVMPTCTRMPKCVELLSGIILVMISPMMLLSCGPRLCSAAVELGRIATLYVDDVRPIAARHFNEVRRIASHPDELGHLLLVHYNETRPIAMGQFNELRRIITGYFEKLYHAASYPGELGSIVSVHYNELRRVAPEYGNRLYRVALRYRGGVQDFFNHCLNYNAPTRQADGNESETESEFEGIVITSNEVSPDLDRDGTQSGVNGDNDTNSETDSDTDSDTEGSRTPITGEGESDGDIDTGSESDGSVTPVSDEDEDWDLVDMAMAEA